LTATGGTQSSIRLWFFCAFNYITIYCDTTLSSDSSQGKNEAGGICSFNQLIQAIDPLWAQAAAGRPTFIFGFGPGKSRIWKKNFCPQKIQLFSSVSLARAAAEAVSFGLFPPLFGLAGLPARKKPQKGLPNSTKCVKLTFMTIRRRSSNRRPQPGHFFPGRRLALLRASTRRRHAGLAAAARRPPGGRLAGAPDAP
jgi:hypothetical protein